MSFAVHLPLLSIICSFCGVVLCSLLPRKKARLCAFICEIFAFVCGIILIIYSQTNAPCIYQMGHLTHIDGDETLYYWFNNVIRFGSTEALLATVFPAIMFFSVLGSIGKLEDDIAPEKEKYFYVLSNLALVALLALVYADDIFTGYVFLEISTLSSIGLIAIKDKGRTTVAAIRYMIFNLVGSGLFLIGIVLLYDLTGYFMFEKIQETLTVIAEKGTSLPVAVCSVSLITVGLGIKSGLFPFYFWMADTYGESTTASASIISGLISKGYIFLLMKFLYRAFGFATSYNGITLGIIEETGITNVLFSLGVCGMIFGSLSALFEKRINKMIAYSSAAQIGYIYLALGLGKVGLTAAVFQIIAHTVTKPLLFVSARGLINASDHHPQFRYLKGSGFRNIPAGIGFFIGCMSMIGFPATAGFMVKYLFIEAALSDGVTIPQLIVTVAALVISTLLNTGYLLHTVITVYSPKSDELTLPDGYKCKNRAGMLISIGALVVIIIAMGVTPYAVTLISKGLESIGYIAM